MMFRRLVAGMCFLLFTAAGAVTPNGVEPDEGRVLRALRPESKTVVIADAERTTVSNTPSGERTPGEEDEEDERVQTVVIADAERTTVGKTPPSGERTPGEEDEEEERVQTVVIADSERTTVGKTPSGERTTAPGDRKRTLRGK